SASTLFNISRSLGGALGVALLRNLVSWGEVGLQTHIAFKQTFTVLACALICAALFYFWRHIRGRQLAKAQS
ncbi:MAG: hypothetical protein ABJ327_17045, partial [Litoreibacter sp.]